jgi:hypothetical protein
VTSETSGTPAANSKRFALVDQPDLALAGVLVMLGGIAAIGAVDAVPLVRVVLTVPLVLFLPGYALVSAAVPRFVVPSIERVLLAIGTSIALTILVGTVLGWPTFGLTKATWPLALVSLTMILIIIAWARRVHSGVVGARPRFAPMPIRSVLMIGLAVLIVANVIIGARIYATSQEAPVPLQLWMLPIAGEPDQARLGMRAGSDGGDFRLVVSAAGQQIHEFDVEVPAEQTWETGLVLPEDTRDIPVVARLYEDGSDVESRFVTLVPDNRGS